MASAATVRATSGPNWSSKWSGMNRVEYPRSSILRAGSRQAGPGRGVGQLDAESEGSHGPSLGREALRCGVAPRLPTRPAASWAPDTWRSRPAAQQPVWPDEAELKRVHARLSSLPPLVFAGEARHLTRALGEAADGRAFLLQAGDCAESFTEFSADGIRDKLKVILQMAVVLTYGAGRPGGQGGPDRRAVRQAPQLAHRGRRRPGARLLPRAHGQRRPARAGGRVPDPARLVTAYQQSVSTLNLLRAFTKGGFADLSQVHAWNQQFVASSTEGRPFEDIAEGIDRALRFMAACGINLTAEDTLHEVDFWTSHEALILDYEEALTRRDSLTEEWYDCSAHMLWVGERTRQLDGAHCEFLSGIHNPVGSKIGPAAGPDEVIALCERLNPERIPGGSP